MTNINWNLVYNLYKYIYDCILVYILHKNLLLLSYLLSTCLIEYKVNFQYAVFLFY